MAQPGRQHQAAQENAEGDKGGCARAWSWHPGFQALDKRLLPGWRSTCQSWHLRLRLHSSSIAQTPWPYRRGRALMLTFILLIHKHTTATCNLIIQLRAAGRTVQQKYCSMTRLHMALMCCGSFAGCQVHEALITRSTHLRKFCGL